VNSIGITLIDVGHVVTSVLITNEQTQTHGVQSHCSVHSSSSLHTIKALLLQKHIQPIAVQKTWPHEKKHAALACRTLPQSQGPTGKWYKSTTLHTVLGQILEPRVKEHHTSKQRSARRNKAAAALTGRKCSVKL
jgi:hypothetical protein